ERFADAGGEHCPAIEAAEVAEAAVDAQLVFAGGLLGNVADGATGGVAPVQRALRATQHFDAIDIEQVEHRAVLAGDVDIVDVQRHRRVVGEHRFVGAYATHDDLGT